MTASIDPKKLTPAQCRCLLRLADHGPQHMYGKYGKYTVHRNLVRKRLARFVDRRGVPAAVDKNGDPLGSPSRRRDNYKCEITEAGSKRLRALGVLTTIGLCDELAARGVPEKWLVPIRTGESPEPPGSPWDHAFAVYERVKALKLGWAIIGFDHNWHGLAVFLDNWMEQKKFPGRALPSGFNLIEGCIVAAASVAYGLPSGDWRREDIPPGGEATYTVSPVVDHRPLHLLVRSSCARSFRIDVLRAGVEPLVHGGVSLSLSARRFAPTASPPLALRPLLIERGTDVSVTVTNTSSKPRTFAATLVGASLEQLGERPLL